MKKLISIIVALVLVLGLAVPAFADGTVKPTSHTSENVSHPGITSVTIASESAIFEQDSNTGNQVYIRAELPNTSGTEYGLKNAIVVISTDQEIPEVKYGSVTQNATNEDYENFVFTYTLDMMNKAYTVTVGSDDYILAAGIQDGRVNVSTNDPLKLDGYLVSSTNTIDTFGSCQNNPYMGNPYYSSGWTFISYFFSATLPTGSNTADVPGSLTVANGATLSTTASALHSNYYDFSSGHNATVTNSGASRVYYPRLSVTGGTITISRANYDFNFTELKKPENSDYYTSTIAAEVEDIEAAWSAYLTQDAEDLTFQSGTTAMVVLEDFIHWAETNYKEGTTHYFTGTSNTSNGTYLSRLNGLDASDCGYLAGFMYATESYRWNNANDHSALGTYGADQYVLTNSNYIVWFYTVDFTQWVNWF